MRKMKRMFLVLYFSGKISFSSVSSSSRGGSALVQDTQLASPYAYRRLRDQPLSCCARKKGKEEKNPFFFLQTPRSEGTSLVSQERCETQRRSSETMRTPTGCWRSSSKLCRGASRPVDGGTAERSPSCCPSKVVERSRLKLEILMRVHPKQTFGLSKPRVHSQRRVKSKKENWLFPLICSPSHAAAKSVVGNFQLSLSTYNKADLPAVGKACSWQS